MYGTDEGLVCGHNPWIFRNEYFAIGESLGIDGSVDGLFGCNSGFWIASVVVEGLEDGILVDGSVDGLFGCNSGFWIASVVVEGLEDGILVGCSGDLDVEVVVSFRLVLVSVFLF